MPGGPPWPPGARRSPTRIDGWYVAFDLDAIDAAEGLAVAMPEPDGLTVAAATRRLTFKLDVARSSKTRGAIRLFYWI